jgi:hypothetical protein
MKQSLVLLIVLALIGPLSAIPWPVAPTDAVHPLGNNWGEYQNYGGSGYYHNGIDVFPTAPGAPAYAVAHGWVKAWGTIQAEYHYRLAISDSPPSVRTRCPGWLYAHIDPNRTHKNVGDEVNVGDQIGYLVAWPVSGFDHTHFARISDTGATWNRFPDPTWWFTTNPLLIIQPVLDTVRPVIQDARSGQRFAFCRNNTNTYVNDLNTLTGDVDIVVRAYDKTGVPTSNPTWDKLVPYKYVWSARGSAASQPPTLGIIFSGLLPTSTVTNLTGVTFKETSPCQSLGDYDNRDYFVIATNNGDGDSTIDIRDTSGCWHTHNFPDDYYWIKVTVSDVVGNSTMDSIRVRTANGNGIAEEGISSSWHHLDVPTLTKVGANLSFSLDLPRSKPIRLELFDLSGRLEQQAFNGSLALGGHTLGFSPTQPGVHLLVLTIGQDRIVHKMTVVR